ncbi:MAG: Asp-tRNA(Asn)/Glu-tRNA(Gln) amidotransferase subunit GatB [Phycisphaerae bacterium]|nr:Asp-tRNA(Asn)/Glu-tRNA(Gln) amidotransferase subunit GatB [Phycisphaerae bacterium]HON93019.1 Asp-tRNA(Asn)/Glu-tRNA(Gln) amidotransferase subunit GatB [Sedimentisphaerales bacterium]
MSDWTYKIVVGLEIHVQLNTRTKMFCGCALGFGEEANSRVCPVCLGLPGALPVMNEQAVEHALLAAMALHCEIASFTKWDRKNYYYPDLPKNYQISQYDLPLGGPGYIEIPLEDGKTKRVRIRRVHLEEDAGKNLHTAGYHSQVDLNRAGTPLLEIVTEPDLNSPEQVRALAVELQRIVRYLGVSEADMQKGHMRFEPNVNLVLEKDGRQFKTPIVEVKNLNSFRALERSVAYEARRQLDDFLETGRTMQMGNKSTRGWDDVNEVTVLQREKEEAHDYRYFPDPDLVPVVPSEPWLARVRSRLCELPVQREVRYVQEYGLSAYDAGVLTADRSTADFFEQAVKRGASAKRVCNLLTQLGLKLAKDRGCDLAGLGLEPEGVADLAKMIEAGTISASAGNTILTAMVETGKKPEALAQELNLIQKSDVGELERILNQVLAENEASVKEITTNGKKAQKARGYLLGQVMQKTQGQANPKIVSELLSRKLGSEDRKGAS